MRTYVGKALEVLNLKYVPLMPITFSKNGALRRYLGSTSKMQFVREWVAQHRTHTSTLLAHVPWDLLRAHFRKWAHFQKWAPSTSHDRAHSYAVFW